MERQDCAHARVEGTRPWSVEWGRVARILRETLSDLDPNVTDAQVVAALQQAQKELEAGALLTIEADRTRLRVLPFAIGP